MSKWSRSFSCNDSSSEFLHPRTCVTEGRSSPDRGTAIYLATRKSELGIDFEKLVRRHEFQLPSFGIALVLLPAMRRTDLKLVILISIGNVLDACSDLRFDNLWNTFQSCWTLVSVIWYMTLRLLLNQYR